MTESESIQNDFDVLKVGFDKTNEVWLGLVIMVRSFFNFILILTFFYLSWKLYSNFIENFIFKIVLCTISSFTILVLLDKYAGLAILFDKWNDRIILRQANQLYLDKVTNHNDFLNLEKKIQIDYINPLLKNEFYRVRCLSDIGSIQKIEEYYLEYIQLYRDLYPKTSSQFANEVGKNDFDVNDHVAKIGDRVMILGNYHCLATFYPDEKAARINSYWKTMENMDLSLIDKYSNTETNEAIENSIEILRGIIERKKQIDLLLRGK